MPRIDKPTEWKGGQWSSRPKRDGEQREMTKVGMHFLYGMMKMF